MACYLAPTQRNTFACMLSLRSVAWCHLNKRAWLNCWCPADSVYSYLRMTWNGYHNYDRWFVLFVRLTAWAWTTFLCSQVPSPTVQTYIRVYTHLHPNETGLSDGCKFIPTLPSIISACPRCRAYIIFLCLSYGSGTYRKTSQTQ